MNEVALFESALRVAVPTRPDPRIGAVLVPRLAQVARAATIEAETQASRRGSARSGRARRALVARICIAIGLIPLVLAGLAFAGVTVPGPARDAFDSVGITLPNQPSEDASQSDKAKGPSGDPQGGNEVSDAAKTKAKGKGGNSTAAHEHARNQREKAKGKAKGQDQGKAFGLNDAAPPSQAQTHQAPAHSNSGGSAQSESVRPAPPSHAVPFPQGNSRGGGRFK